MIYKLVLIKSAQIAPERHKPSKQGEVVGFIVFVGRKV
jgi:hypothetical protein